jgi:hypothetical protein
MKIKRFIFFLFVGVILSGVITGVFILAGEMNALPGRIDQNQAQTTENHAASSISKGTILLLLAVGVIGALGVSRQKKSTGGDSHSNLNARAGENANVNEGRQKLMTRNR